MWYCPGTSMQSSVVQPSISKPPVFKSLLCTRVSTTSPVQLVQHPTWLHHKQQQQHAFLSGRRGSAGLAASSLGRRALLGAATPCFCCGCGSCAGRNSWYDNFFAFNMAHGMQEYETAIAPLKAALFGQLFATLTNSSSSSSSRALNVLEVGMGTGPNLAFYPEGLLCEQQQQQQQQQLTVTGLEPNPAMWQYAQQAAAARGLGPQQLQLVAGDAQQMPFAQDAFDAAVVTLVLCSLPNPNQALLEIMRVLKPGGSLLLIEHVLAPGFSWLQVQQRLLDPLQQLLADNCHLTRDTAVALQHSGFEAEALQPYSVGSVAAAADKVINGSSGLLGFEVEGMSLISPHLAGILKKPLAA